MYYYVGLAFPLAMSLQMYSMIEHWDRDDRGKRKGVRGYRHDECTPMHIIESLEHNFFRVGTVIIRPP